MQHPEPEALALAGLGEPLDEATRDHLDACEQCREEVASFSAAVSVGRMVAADGSDTLVAPPPQVWGRIRDELGLRADLEPGGILLTSATEAPVAATPVVRAPAAETPVPEATRSETPLSEATGPQPHPASGPGAHAEPGPAPAMAEVRSLRDRSGRPSGRSMRRPTMRWIAAAAAAGVVVGGGGATWWADRGSPAPAVVEAAALDALPGWTGATGAAKVEVAADGTRRLVVTLGGAKAEAGYREVWLIDTGVTKLVSLGVLDGSTGTFTLPQGLDLGLYPVVDISEEHFDGNPAHSGDSIVRGILET